MRLTRASNRLSQYNEGIAVIYEAMHNRRGGRAMYKQEIVGALQEPSRKGGHAKFIRPSTISKYLSIYNGVLWERFHPDTLRLNPPGEGIYYPIPLAVALVRLERFKARNRRRRVAFMVALPRRRTRRTRTTPAYYAY